MKTTTSHRLLAAAALLVVASCSEPTATAISGPLSLSVVSGDGQSGLPGSVLPDPLVVVVKDERGRRVRNQIVNFRVVSGGGSTFAGVAITNNDGIAQERWTLGESGVQRLEARAIDPSTGEPLTFAVFEATLEDGVAPLVSGVAASPDPGEPSASVTVSATATDAGSGIAAMQVRIASGAFTPMTATDGAFDSGAETAQAVVAAPSTEGIYPVCVSARDVAGNASAEVCVTLVVRNAPLYTIGGTVSGLTGTLVLRNNGGDERTISANGPFTFATSLPAGSAYNVTVASQPFGQTCTVSGAFGTVGSANVTTVNVNCTTLTYSVGGTVSNLLGAGCTLRLNGGPPLTLTGSGPFTFPTQLPNGSSYSVSVASQPTGPNQTCTVSNGTGTISGANVTNVALNCTTTQASCTSATSLGSMAGDDGGTVFVANGTSSAWYRVRLREDNDGIVYLSASITLTVPAGADYDLYLYCASCGGGAVAQSANGSGQTDVVHARWDDDWGSDDSYDILIEVRYFSGSSTSPWSLNVTGNTSVANNTCDP